MKRIACVLALLLFAVPALAGVKITPPAGVIPGNAHVTGSTQLDGAVVIGSNGAASTPALHLNGSIYTGGINATTFPKFFISNSGATASTTLPTNGTQIGINAAGSFAGRMLGFMIDGVAKFIVRLGSQWMSPPSTSVLTGTVATTASTTFTGTGTKFLSELMIGDKITKTGETRTVTAIASDTSATADTAFTATADDVACDRYPVGLSITPADSSVGTDIFVNPAVKSSGYLMDLRVGGVTQFSVSNNGTTVFLGGSSSVGTSGFNDAHTGSGITGVYRVTGALANAAGAGFVFSGKPAIHSAGTDLEAFRSFPDLSNNHTGGNWISYSAPDLVSPDADIVKYGVRIGSTGTTTSGYDYPIIASPPTAQTIAAGNTILANGCGTVKMVTAAGAVTTDTTNTFAAPSAANAGCCMTVFNSGAQNITLDNNALFVSPGAADVVMTANDAIKVCSTGSVWFAASALVAN